MSYLARRGILFLATLWAALTINFIIPRVMPGNEASAVLGTFRGINPAALHALQIQFGVHVHHGIISSYFEYLGNCLTGQFGVTTVIAFLIGTLAGIASAWRRGGRIDAILPPTLFIVSTIPVFFVGLLL